MAFHCNLWYYSYYNIMNEVEKMIQIAILGYGVVGSSIVQVLEENRRHIENQAGCAISVKKVLDIRNFSHELGALYTNDFETILQDSEIRIIAEAIGGVEPAYSYIKQALLAGKHVCTSNKEVVSKYGAELLLVAKKQNINFMFEASVGGGIPVVRPINLALTTDEIISVSGILNGTSNYMLTQMQNLNKSYNEALIEAQQLGFAESDPTADVGGFDACRKLAILMSIATGKQVNCEDIPTYGIQEIDEADFAFARAFEFTLKPMVDGYITKSGISAISSPMLVHQSSPFFTIQGVYNGVVVVSKTTGTVMFYGQGAGKFPTAGAVISDIVDITKHLHTHVQFNWLSEKNNVLHSDAYVTRKLIRVSYECRDKLAEHAKTASIIELPDYPGQAAWITEPETQELFENGLKIIRILRIFDDKRNLNKGVIEC